MPEIGYVRGSFDRDGAYTGIERRLTELDERAGTQLDRSSQVRIVIEKRSVA